MNLDIQCIDEKSISNVGDKTNVSFFGYNNRYQVINSKIFYISHLFHDMPSFDDLCCIPRIDFILDRNEMVLCKDERETPCFNLTINVLFGIDISPDDNRNDYFFILTIKSKQYNRGDFTKLINDLYNKLKELFQASNESKFERDTSDYLNLLCNASTDILKSNIKLTTSICNSYKTNKMLDDNIRVKYLLNYDGNIFNDFKYVKNEKLKRYFHIMGWNELKPLKYNVYPLSGVVDKTGLSYLYQKLKTPELYHEALTSENKSVGSVVIYPSDNGQDYYYTNFVYKMVGEIDLLASEKYIYTLTVLVKTDLPDDDIPENNNIFMEMK